VFVNEKSAPQKGLPWTRNFLVRRLTGACAKGMLYCEGLGCRAAATVVQSAASYGIIRP